MPYYRLISWNLNGRIGRIPEQVAALATRHPDFLCLQEVTAGTIPLLQELVGKRGLPHIVHSFAHSAQWEATGPRRYGLLIASRLPAQFVPHASPITWPERIITVSIQTFPEAFLLTTTHTPPGSTNGWTKVEMLEALAQVIAEDPTARQIVCGDLNTPQVELPSGEVLTWAQRLTPNGPRIRERFRGGSGARWDAAERTLLTGTRLRDAFRTKHGYRVEEFSWWMQRHGRKTGRRYDHILCSPEIRVHTCEYLHAMRTVALSDHSPLEATFSFTAR